MFQSFRESIIKLAREEQDRKSGIGSSSSSQGKKKKKKKYQHIVVNAERVAIFDFQAAPEYAEQVSVKPNEIVFVFESFDDGWSQIRNAAGQQGVIPTAYLGNIIAPEKDLTRKGSYFSAQFKQRLQLLGWMAADQFREKFFQAVMLVFYGLQFLVTFFIIPACFNLFLLLSRSESYTTILSNISRRCYEFVVTSLIHSLGDEELASFTAQLGESAAKIKAESARRNEMEKTEETVQ